MADYLPIVVVFVIGFVGYLGKIGVTGVLARRRRRRVEIKSGVQINFPTPYLDRLNSMSSEDRKKEFAKYNDPAPSDEPVEPKLARCALCSNILSDDTLDQRRSVPGVWSKCVSCRRTEMAVKDTIKDIEKESLRKKPSVEERWQPLVEEDPFAPVRPEPVEEENIFQATEEDKIWYENLAGHVTRLRSLRSMPSVSYFFKPESVTRTIRILPPFDEKILPEYSAFDSVDTPSRGLFASARQHYIDPSNGKVYQCGKTRNSMGDWMGECPICEGHMVFPDRKSKATEKFYYNVSLVGGSQISPVPKIWSVSRKVHEQIQEEIVKSGDISDLMTGCNIKVTRGHQGGRPFPETHLEFEEPSRISRDNIENVLANLWDLDEYVESCAKSTEELEVATCRQPAGLRRCQHCKKIYKVLRGSMDSRFCSAQCRVLTDNDTPSDKPEEEELRVGHWVHWTTQSGTTSIRPSVVYATEMRKITGYYPGWNKAGARKTEQWVKLKYKQSHRWKPFWVQATKCQLLSKSRPPFKGTKAKLGEDRHIEKMYADFSKGNDYTSMS